MIIETETDHAGTDLNDVIGILHKEIERGYISVSQTIALAELVTDARERAARESACEAVNPETGRACVLAWPHDGEHQVADGRWFGGPTDV